MCVWPSIKKYIILMLCNVNVKVQHVSSLSAWRANIGWMNKGNFITRLNAWYCSSPSSGAIMLYSLRAAVVPGRVRLCRCQQGLLCVQVWRYISGRAASSFRAAAKDHPGCSSTDGTTAQCHWGRLYNSTLCACLFLSHFYDCFFVNLNLLHCNFCLQGKYSKQTLKDIGTFLKFMETQNNVKVSSNNASSAAYSLL